MDWRIAYCLFDKICVSALRDAPIILPSHVCIMVVVMHYAVTARGLTALIVTVTQAPIF
jgi:hypothetical protein